jgi:hypothetical protein
MKALLVALVLGVISFPLAAFAKDEDKPAIDVVFCIDCSGSMGGVIDTAKQKVWAIVNELAKAKPSPVLRIGLIGYGNGMGPFRKFDLSDDLDDVYKNLMTFKDEGWGEEFVGLAVQRATDEMKWANGSKVLKVIYVVGNETAHQGPPESDYSKTAPLAVNKGIVVNAIYCGETEYATATPTWREMSRLADGQYMEIAGNGGAIVINTPYDDDLAKLNTKLNSTYVAYGPRGAAGQANQVQQDAAATTLAPAVMAQRAEAKAGKFYQNANWDLVDASTRDDFDLAKINEADLPEDVRKLPPEKRNEYIQAKAKERADVQAQIKDLSEKRAKVVEEETKKQGLATDKSLDEAVKTSIKEQATKKGFQFEETK